MSSADSPTTNGDGISNNVIFKQSLIGMDEMTIMVMINRIYWWINVNIDDKNSNDDVGNNFRLWKYSYDHECKFIDSISEWNEIIRKPKLICRKLKYFVYVFFAINFFLSHKQMPEQCLFFLIQSFINILETDQKYSSNQIDLMKISRCIIILVL